MDIGNLSEIVTAAVAFIGVAVSLFEYHRSNKINRSSYLKDLISEMKTDADISEMIYIFQYHKFIYDRHFHEDGELERKVDKSLQFFSYLCYLKETRIITDQEFSFFEIEISQALRNKDLIDYLYNLYHFICNVEGYNPVSKGTNMSVYGSLIKFGKKKHLIDDSFFDKNIYKEGIYHHYLNF